MKIVNGNEILIFVSSKDSAGKHDASGAFIPEAMSLKKNEHVPDDNLIMIDCTKSNPAISRRKQVIEALNGRSALKMICFFGHGWPSGIQFGFNNRNVDILARHIAYSSYEDVSIVLYACLTAENEIRDSNHKNIGPGTDGGFADKLRDQLVRNGVTKGRVDAHKTAGHTSWNPYVVRFSCEAVSDPEYGGVGGAWLVSPGSIYWKEWCKRLRSDSKFRQSFPLMRELEILSLLSEKKINR